MQKFFVLFLVLAVFMNNCRSIQRDEKFNGAIPEDSSTSEPEQDEIVMEPEKQEDSIQIFLTGEQEGIISVSQQTEENAEDTADGFQLIEEKNLEDLTQKIKENRDLLIAITATTLVGSVTALAVKNRAAIKNKIDYMQVFAGLTKNEKTKIKVFKQQHIKNLRKSLTDPSSDFTEIKVTHLPYVENGRQILSKNSPGKLVLGVLPSDEVLTRVSKEVGGGKLSVLSIVENFELNSPITWRHNGVDLHFKAFDRARIAGEWKQFNSPDYRPVKGDIIDEGADFIAKKLEEGDTIYVHCKSGKGRSATLVAAYLIKYRGLSTEEAVSLLKSQRNAVSIGGFFDEHYPNLKKYEASLRAKYPKLPQSQ